jgi:hypothetical protein
LVTVGGLPGFGEEFGGATFACTCSEEVTETITHEDVAVFRLGDRRELFNAKFRLYKGFAKLAIACQLDRFWRKRCEFL